MASASSSRPASLSESSYQIFINHRGPDVKKTFATHLYRWLVSRRFTVFLDQEGLQVGESLTSQIQTAIGNASVHIAIFSRGYAESSWCLKELVLMLNTGKPILPVFYHVTPADLRWTLDENFKYTRALRDLQMKKTNDSQTLEKQPRYDPATIQNWRNALSHVAGICGLDLDAEFNGDEGKLVDKIVEQVLILLKKPLCVPKFPVGLDEKVQDFEKKVLWMPKFPIGLDEKVQDFEKKVLWKQHNGIVGITGFGGVGKTTLATEIFKRKKSNYRRSYFLSDVREKAKRAPLQYSLQSQLLKGLFQLDLHINNSHQGTEMLRNHLFSSQVLLVLDDVDDVDQVDALLPHKEEYLRPDSLILITSRDKDVLARSGIQDSSIYELTGLNPHHSKELFCQHAFKRPQPLPKFEYLVDMFLRICYGFPLFLKVFGALVYGNNEIYWENQLNRLCCGHIKQRLKIIYEALNNEEQNMFLDIVCFFRGHGSDWTIRIMNASGWQGSYGFQNLQDKCLVGVDRNNDIRIHDHIRDLGREIVAEGSTQFPFCFRPWPEDIESSDQQLISEVRGIRLFPSEFVCSKILWYRGILHLKYTLDLLERILGTVQRHSRNLVWLSWFDCPYSSLPSWFPIKNLKVLYVGGRELKTLWQSESQAPSQLLQLEINAPIQIIPKSIGQLKHIEHIRVVYSEAGKLLSVPMITIPEEICHLWSLKILMLRGCSKVKSLPDSLGNLTNLESLVLDFCQSLGRLPISFGNLIRLKHLDLDGCHSLTISTETFGNISALQYLRLSNCSKIEVLPPQIANQWCLESLDLSGTNIKSLPSDIGKLSNLKYLTIQSCNGLVEIGTLPNALIELDSFGCLKLRKIEESLCGLEKLQILNISGCVELEELPSIETLVSLENLWAFRCAKLKRIRGLASLKRLQILDVSDCLDIEELPGVENLRSLEKLDASRCPKLQWDEGVVERLRKQLKESMLIL